MVEGFGSGDHHFPRSVDEGQSSSMGGEQFQSSNGLQGFDPKRRKINMSADVPREINSLGLKLSKSPSFVELIETKLCHSNTDLAQRIKRQQKPQTESEKWKASKFPALSLQIGSWKRVASYDDDLVAKCYYGKGKLVWEVLDGGLKSKMEFQWTHISAIRALFIEGQSSILELELSRPPIFSCETNPVPRKHTMWKNADDFTGGQAQICRRHRLTFREGVLQKHYEKLLRCDTRLFMLNRKPFPSLNSPYFDIDPSNMQAIQCDMMSKYPDRSQLPLVGNLGTSNFLNPSTNSSMGVNLLSNGMNFLPSNSDVAIPTVTNSMPSCSVNNNFQPNAGINGFFDANENQNQIQHNWRMNSIEQNLFSEPQTPSFANDQHFLDRLSSLASSLYDVVNSVPTTEGLNLGNGEEYQVGNSNTSMAIGTYNGHVNPNANMMNGGGYIIHDSNYSVAPNGYNQLMNFANSEHLDQVDYN